VGVEVEKSGGKVSFSVSGLRREGVRSALRGAAISFVNLGHLEAAAVLIGFADARYERWGTELFL